MILFLVSDASKERLETLLRGVAKRHFTWVVPLALAAILLFSNLDDRDLWPSHEARAAQNAAGFLESGHWGLMRLFDSTPEFQKPPLYYWLVALVAWLHGGVVDAWSVRLPAAISGWLTMTAIVMWLHRRGRPIAGCVAGLALCCANHWLATARTGRIDVPLTFCVTMAILQLHGSPTRKQVRSPPLLALRAPGLRGLVAGCAIGSTLLFKGPIGLILVAAVAIAANSTRNLFATLIACLVGAVIAAPWYVAVNLQTGGEFGRVFFWHHNFQRAAGTAADLASHPAWFYPARWIVDWLPATPLLFIALFLALRHRWWRDDAELRLGLIWTLTITALLSVARFKRADYLLPAYSGAALVIGCVGERFYQSMQNRRWLVSFGAATLGIMLGLAVCYECAVLPQLDQLHEKRSFAADIRRIRNADQPVILFRVEDHLLAFHLGKPLQSIKEWENLDWWVARLDPGYIVLPADEVDAWPSQIHSGTLREVLRYIDPTDRKRPRSLVVMESCPHRPDDDDPF